MSGDKVDEYDGFLKQEPGFATKAIRVGQQPYQPLVPSIGLSTTFKQFAPGQHGGYVYSRSGNPTRTVVEKCLASMDDAKYCCVFSSGLGAQTAQ
jgi:cystathionine gamma-lyase